MPRVSTQVSRAPYCACGIGVRYGRGRFAVSDSAARASIRSVERVALPTFWDGVAQAFDIRGQHPPYNFLDDKGADLYVSVVNRWLRYGARARSVAERHLPDTTG